MTEKPERSKRRRQTISRLELDDWRVLVVDDRKDNLMIAQEALQFHGATVEIAHNGIEGLEKLKLFKATLILLDLSMPEMNGWDMFKKLRENPDTAGIPVIALTAHVMAGDEDQVMDAGFDGYIPKPFSVAAIVLQIQSILEKVAEKKQDATHK